MLIAALYLTSLAKTHASNPRMSCVNNLKQIGIAYRVWEGDNNDKFPMSVSTNQGGPMELVLAGDVVSSSRAMSNELSTSKILLCQSDNKPHTATNFTDFKISNIS